MIIIHKRMFHLTPKNPLDSLQDPFGNTLTNPTTIVNEILPHVMWASGCWHYERTLYSRRPLKGTGASISE
jgi:hypothetical protein